MTDAELAARYWVSEIAPGLVKDGVPAKTVYRMQQRYVRDCCANSEALEQLHGWAQANAELIESVGPRVGYVDFAPDS